MPLTDRELQRMRGRDMSMIVPNPRSELNPILTVGQQIANVATRPSASVDRGRRSAWHLTSSEPSRSLIPSGG